MTDVSAILPRASPRRVVQSAAVRRGAFARLEKMALPNVDAGDVLHPETEADELSILDGPWGWIMRAGLYLGGALLGYGLVRGAMLMYTRLTHSVPAIAAVPSDPLDAVVSGATSAATPTALLDRARALLSRAKAS